MSEVVKRVCRKCSVEKALCKDLWVQNKESRDGFRQPCRECFYAERKSRVAELISDPQTIQKKYPSGFKTCAACKLDKALSCFGRSSGVLHSRCRVCASLRWKNMTPEQRKAYYKSQIVSHNKSTRKWRLRNPEKMSAASKAWRINNPDKAREKARRDYHRAKAVGGAILVRKAMTVRINSKLKRLAGITKKNASWPAVLGYSAEALSRHIERQFRDGMTWQNWGTVWHLDHVVPASSFDVREVGDKEFLACWAMTNLRPLCAKENMKKSDKRLYLL